LWLDLADFQGTPQAFWPLLATTGVRACGGELGVVYLRQSGEQGELWLAVASAPELPLESVPTMAGSVPAEVLADARRDGVGIGMAIERPWRVAAVCFDIEDGQHELVLALHIPVTDGTAESDLRFTLAPLQCLPRLYESRRRQLRDERDNTRLAQTLELLGRVLESDSFERAALGFVNDLAERFGCESVALCWQGRGGLKLRALSHAEKLERRSEVSQWLEEVGQEALAQGCEIAWPASGQAITHAHRQYAELQMPGNMLTLPLLGGGERVGAVTLERRRMGFTAAEQWALRMICDMGLVGLRILHAPTRPLPQRLWEMLRGSIPARLKPGTLDGRKFAELVAIGVAGLLLLPVPYWVSSGAIVKTDAMAYVGAPFDGYLEKGQATPGAVVAAGEVLFEMATRELVLERAGILADIAQYVREAEKRRAANQLPEMQIAEAQAAQAAARLKLVEFRLATAKAKSPIAGIVIEGEPGKNLGGAVRRGDTMVKVAALQSLYVEAAVDERDIGRIEVGASVRLSLLADTGKTYWMHATRIVPAANVREGANTFPVRIEFEDSAPSWWRPGMSGVAKLYVGLRPVGWIASHRLVDYLRLLLWI